MHANGYEDAQRVSNPVGKLPFRACEPFRVFLIGHERERRVGPSAELGERRLTVEHPLHLEGHHPGGTKASCGQIGKQGLASWKALTVDLRGARKQRRHPEATHGRRIGGGHGKHTVSCQDTMDLAKRRRSIQMMRDLRHDGTFDARS